MISIQAELVGTQPDNYYDDKLAEMQAGETVWVRRNFNADSGFCVDLFKGLQHLGYIASEFDNPYRRADGFTAVPYILTLEGPESLEIDGDERPQAPEFAALLLLQYFKRQGLIN